MRVSMSIRGCPAVPAFTMRTVCIPASRVRCHTITWFTFTDE